MNILVTGGAGYIGTHTLIELIAKGHHVIVVDNFSNSQGEAVRRVEKITGVQISCYEIDCMNKTELGRVFDESIPDAVIHFAGFKAVGESVAEPLRYYRNNIDSTLSLCETMKLKGVKKLIFSSSATVYGNSKELPLREDNQTGVGITNPYGQTKYMIEQILNDLVIAEPSWKVVILRYFNPVGAHESGLIGEDPNGVPNNLIPYISQVAAGKLDRLRIFGGDYETADGTGVRDYLHVVDLAKGHVAALNRLDDDVSGLETYNLGTGKGVSVLDILHAYEKACGKALPYEIVNRRQGDVAVCYANTMKASNNLRWAAKKSIEDACIDAWRWQSQNPDGYNSK